MTSEEAGAGPSVVVTARSFGSGDADPAGLLQNAGLRVECADLAHDHAVLGEALPAAVAWIAGTYPIDDRHLAEAPNLKIVSRYGIRPPLRGRELGTLTVGIIGFGRIGRTVAYRLIGGVGSRVLA